MSRVAAQRPRGGDVPQEDGLVAAAADESRVVIGDRDREDLVAVRAGEGLDEGRGFGGIVEVDSPIR